MLIPAIQQMSNLKTAFSTLLKSVISQSKRAAYSKGVGTTVASVFPP